MGAYQFQTSARGKTVSEAFNQAHSDAQYESGHGGYTGTIAEKPGAILFDLPADVTPEDFMNLAFSAEYGMSEDGDEEDKEAAARLIQLVGRRTARRLVHAASNKWDECAAVKSGPDEYLFFGYASS